MIKRFKKRGIVYWVFCDRNGDAFPIMKGTWRHSIYRCAEGLCPEL